MHRAWDGFSSSVTLYARMAVWEYRAALYWMHACCFFSCSSSRATLPLPLSVHFYHQNSIRQSAAAMNLNSFLLLRIPLCFIIKCRVISKVPGIRCSLFCIVSVLETAKIRSQIWLDMMLRSKNPHLMLSRCLCACTGLPVDNKVNLSRSHWPSRVTESGDDHWALTA